MGVVAAERTGRHAVPQQAGERPVDLVDPAEPARDSLDVNVSDTPWA
jgi:hypothetical protein